MRKNKKQLTFRQTLVKALLIPAIMVGGFAGSYGIVSAMNVTKLVPAEPGVHGNVDTETPAEHVLKAHQNECWGGSQEPKAQFPGAAIVRLNDGRVVYTKKHVLVDAAFNEALANIGFGDKTSDKLDVVALCK